MADEKLKPASENPWYVLATIAGTRQEDGSRDVSRENARLWNGWIRIHFSDIELKKLHSVLEFELPELTEEDNVKIQERFLKLGIDLPDPSNLISFQRTHFPGGVDFSRFIFPTNIDFTEFIFDGDAIFHQSIFLGGANFSNSTFNAVSSFHSSHFVGNNVSEFPADFSNATFEGITIFSKVHFFKHRIFRDSVLFTSAKFHEIVEFNEISVDGDADYRSAIFAKNTRFDRATFMGSANFQAAEFLSSSNFEDATFKLAPPEFFETKLSENANWRSAKFPMHTEKEKGTLSKHIRSYESLRLIMNKQNKFHDEHVFLRKELRCREIEEGWSAAGMGSRLYRVISDYGWSVKTPASIIGGMMLLCWFVLMWQECMYGAVNEEVAKGGPVQCFGKAGILSFASIFGFLGIGRVFLREEFEALSAVSQFFTGSLMVFGPLMLFFLILALRNRFRIK